MKKQLKHYLMGILLVAFGMMSSQAWAERLFATTNPGGGNPSTLLEINPTTGALISTIGDVGYAVNGMTYDDTTSTLYATTSTNDPGFPDGLLTINTSTGAGTPVGTGAGQLVNVPAVNSAGELYGWTEDSDSLVLWDKAAGTITVRPNSIGSSEQGLAFDNADTLYLVNGGPDIYQMNTATGTGTSLGTVAGTPNGIAHHGDFNPVSNLYVGLDVTRSYGTPIRNLLVIDVTTQALVNTIPTVNDLHTLAFLPGMVPAATATAAVPVMGPMQVILLSLLLIATMLFVRRRGSI